MKDNLLIAGMHTALDIFRFAVFSTLFFYDSPKGFFFKQTVLIHPTHKSLNAAIIKPSVKFLPATWKQV